MDNMLQIESSRIEQDLLGKKQIPQHSYYGIHTLRAIENFQISGLAVGQQAHFIRALAQVKKAAAQTNLHFQKISEQQSSAIQQACDELIHQPQDWQEAFPLDPYQGGAGTSINMNANEVIANRALELLGHRKGDYHILHPNDHVNTSQSTNDVYPTALRLATYTRLDELLHVQKSLIDTLYSKAS